MLKIRWDFGSSSWPRIKNVQPTVENSANTCQAKNTEICRKGDADRILGWQNVLLKDYPFQGNMINGQYYADLLYQTKEGCDQKLRDSMHSFASRQCILSQNMACAALSQWFECSDSATCTPFSGLGFMVRFLFPNH